MAFEGLGEKLQNAMRKLSGKGTIREADLKEVMREVRLALLEADVNYRVVRDFTKKVTERALGADVARSLTPGQQVVKIVHEELTELMGAQHSRLTFSSKPITVYMLCGLQGAGKTTMAAKLGRLLKNTQGKRPLLVACDVYLPAAIRQLQIVGEQAGVPVFTVEGSKDPVAIAKASLEHAAKYGNNVVILDTAGRLHIDDELMDELSRMREATQPQEILLVIDAMTGQDSVNVAEGFQKVLPLDGVILTKLDSDTRGGAALSVKAVTGKPIKFAGVSEKLDGIEVFHPDRMASRILGMGDMLSLIEKAEAQYDAEQAQKMAKRIQDHTFDLDDFMAQFEQMNKMGGLSEMMNLLPGGNKIEAGEEEERVMRRMHAILQSMTPRERHNPDILNASRRRRIAAGSGTTVQEVNQLLRQFDQVKNLMKQFTGKGMRRRMSGLRGLKLPF